MDQWAGGKTRRVTVCSALFCFCKRCWDTYWSRDRNQQGDWLLTIIPVCCLTWSSWIPSHMPYSLVSRLCTKLARFLLSTSIISLIVSAAFEDSKGIVWNNEKSCKEHPSVLWPVGKAEGSSDLRSTAQHCGRVSGYRGRSGGLHSEMAGKLHVYVSIRLHLCGFVTD